VAFDPHAAVRLIVGPRHGDHSSAAALAEHANQVLVRVPRQEALVIETRFQPKDVSVDFPRERTPIGVAPSV
jgi:hypothetical protein